MKSLHPDSAGPAMPMVGFHIDEEGHWVARLSCGHNQHVRHDPPWQHRPWVTTEAGRKGALGLCLLCKKCLEGAPHDWQETAQSV